jgi:putative transposase
MKYQFIAEQQQDYPIKTLCRVLGVAQSGYYAWRQREPSRRSQENTVLGERIVRLYQANRQVYGSPCIHAALRARSANSAGASGWHDSCASTG